MILISLSGKKGSGKSTTARLIKDILLAYDSDLNVDLIAWADSLKEEVSKATGVSITVIEQNKPTFRSILQWWGTEFRRKFFNCEGYWIRKLLTKLVTSTADVIIIHDTRFLNEVNTIRELKGYLWRIDRTSSNVEDQHSSETELDTFNQWDCIINNNVALGELKGT